MADIKTKKKQDISIKKLDRATIMGKNLKSNIVDIKDKAKEMYESDENNSQEYAQKKIQNGIRSTAYYGTKKADEIGRYGIKQTKENLKKGKQSIKQFKSTVKKIKKAGERTARTIKKTVKTAKNTIKTTRKMIKTAEKTTKATIKTTQKVAKTSVKVAQRTAQVAKATAKATIKAIQIAIKISIAIVKAIITATEALISAILAGGWVAVVIIIVICLIAMICTSIFGIFFSSENDVGERTMSSVINEINMEFTSKMTEIQNTIEHDEYEINSHKAEWKDILSVYAVSISGGKEQTDVITLDDRKINELKKIFWEMNIITYRIEEIQKEVEITDNDGNIKLEKVTRKVLYIDITSKSVEEMIQLYNFNEKQKIQLAELQKDEYNYLWSSVIYGTSIGSTDIVEVARKQIGNVGGQPYWSWYGYNSRVEWCACFVSWCAEQCNYIESGIIPKFANCENEGVAWFRTCGLWKDGGYSPRSRRHYLF